MGLINVRLIERRFKLLSPSRAALPVPFIPAAALCTDHEPKPVKETCYNDSGFWQQRRLEGTECEFFPEQQRCRGLRPGGVCPDRA
ncbi:hypothetical protein WMY93_031276, partial [Mugilogobius chulae]